MSGTYFAVLLFYYCASTNIVESNAIVVMLLLPCYRDRLSKGQFTLRDLYKQLSSSLKIGPMSKVMGMIPGMSEMSQVREREIEKEAGRERERLAAQLFRFLIVNGERVFFFLVFAIVYRYLKFI